MGSSRPLKQEGDRVRSASPRQIPSAGASILGYRCSASENPTSVEVWPSLAGSVSRRGNPQGLVETGATRPACGRATDTNPPNASCSAAGPDPAQGPFSPNSWILNAARPLGEISVRAGNMRRIAASHSSSGTELRTTSLSSLPQTPSEHGSPVPAPIYGKIFE